MAFCPYCREIVAESVTECPSCGMSWAASGQQQPAGEHRPPQIVNEQPAPPPPAPQEPPQYQQTPQQPQQYQQPPPQQQYQQPQQQYPQQQYQQPPQQYQQQQYPQQQYQQPYGAQPGYGQRPAVKAGGGQMALAVVGGIMAMVSFVALFYTSGGGFSATTSVSDLPSDYAYGWLIPLSGLMIFLFAIIGYAAQNKTMGTLTIVSGLLAVVMPLVLAFHVTSDTGGSITDVFYLSVDYGFASVTNIFIGGILAIVGGILGMAGGAGLSSRIGRVRQPAYRQQPPYPPRY